MPLVAVFGEERVESWLLDDDEWAALRSSYRARGLVMACGQPGVPVEKATGTRFFRHKTDCDAHEGGPESVEHLASKALVAEVARELGWHAEVEAPSADRSWIADVLLTKDGRKPVAVEVQWSAQAAGQFAARTTRYQRDGVLCVWLVGPKNVGRGDWNIDGKPDTLRMETPAVFAEPTVMSDMRHALTVLLRGDIRPRIEVAVEKVLVFTAMSKCHNSACAKWFSYWYLGALQFETRCGQQGTFRFLDEYGIWMADRIELVFQRDVRAVFASSGLPVATEYRKTHSKQTNLDYLAQRCPHCLWHLGDGFIAAEPRRWDWFAVPVTPQTLPLSADVITVQHVCTDSGHGRCSPAPAVRTVYPTQKNALGQSIYPRWNLTGGVLDDDPLPAREPFRGGRRN